MPFRLFRTRFTECVDRRVVKGLLACGFLGVVSLGFVLGIYASAEVRSTLCKSPSYNCTDGSPTDIKADKISFGAGLGILAASCLLVCCITTCIACFRVDPSSDDDEAGQASRRDSRIGGYTAIQ